IDTGPMTVDEFYLFTDARPDGEKWELIDGELILNAAPSDFHQLILKNQLMEVARRSEEHTSELQSPCKLVCRLLLEKKKGRGLVERGCRADRESAGQACRVPFLPRDHRDVSRRFPPLLRGADAEPARGAALAIDGSG